MEGSFLKSTLSMKDCLHHEDTSLALPSAKSLTRTESAQNNFRVQRQVQLTLGQKSKNGGVNLQRNTPRSLDDTDGLFTNTKVNGSDINSLSLKGIHAQRLSRGVGVSPTPSIESGSLIDWPVGSNSAQQYASYKTSRGMATRASVSPPGMYRSKSLRHSGSAKNPSASTPVQQRNTLSHKQSVVKRGKHTVQRGMPRMSGPTQLNRGFTWHAHTSQRQKSNWPFIHSVEVDMRRQEETLPSQKSFKKPPEMTLYRALSLLQQNDEEKLISAAQCIQTKCFQAEEDRKTVFNLDGVAKLLPLLENDSKEVQCAAAGALRNVVYKNANNKTKVKDTKGLDVIMNALENTRDKETISQLAGLLWNLSSDDTIKELFNSRFLHIITKSALVPGSGMSAAENPKDEMIADPKAFTCATGCLRNLSSAGPNVRKYMRECKNLIDSLVYYIQSTVESRKPDDESTEHCACILQNLTYEAEFDLTSQTTEYLIVSEQDTTPQKTAGCFPHRSSKPTEGVKDMKDEENRHLLKEKKDPHGAEWLWSNTLVRLYLSLVACSKQSSTQQAAIGALQNLTARNGQISEYVAFTIEEENGIQKIKMVLEDEDSPPMEPTIFLTSHLSRYPELCPAISKELFPGVAKMVQRLDTKTNVSDEVATHLCWLLENLIKSDVKSASNIDDKALLDVLIFQYEGKAKQKLLDTIWKYEHLQKLLKKFGLKKPPKFTQEKDNKW